MKPAVRIAITGAAGNIGYAAAFRISAGGMLGTDQPIILQLVEIEPALQALKGVEMGVVSVRSCNEIIHSVLTPPLNNYQTCSYTVKLSQKDKT